MPIYSTLSAADVTLMSEYPWLENSYQRICADAMARRLPHAILLSGAEGIAVPEFAAEIAHYRLCSSALSQADQSHFSDKAKALLEKGSHPDLKILEPQGAAQIIKVDQVRELVDFMSKTPQIGDWKVAIIRPAHRMNTNAANALLKVLEEPPGQSLLLLATERPQTLLPTVRSRCSQMRLPNPDRSQAEMYLSSLGIQAEAASAAIDKLGCKPLQIAEWLNSDRMESWKRLSAEVEALELGRSSAVHVASSLKDIDLGLLINWLTESAAKKMKGSLSAKALAAGQTNLFAEYEQVYASLIETRRNLDSGSNPNPQLALESILLDWPKKS